MNNLPPSDPNAIAWDVNITDYECTWTARDYAPALDISITSDNTENLIICNSDKCGSSLIPWYAMDCVLNNDLYIDSMNIVLGIEGYTETTNLTLSRKKYGGLTIVNSISDGINELYTSIVGGGSLTATSNQNGIVKIATQSTDLPNFIIESIDNPYFPVSTGVYQTLQLIFHRNWYIKMPELCSPNGFADAIEEGILKSELKGTCTISLRGKSINVNQPMRIQFGGSNSTFNGDDFNGFIDWSQGTYKLTHIINFPYHTMTMDSPYVTYSVDSQTIQLSVPSRVTQDELVSYMNEELVNNNINVEWIEDADSYIIKADHVFSLIGDM